MPAQVDLRNAGRTVHVGVILLNSVTEILDVAPVDAFNGLRKEFVDSLPSEAVSDELKAQAIDFQIHWVTETGATPAKLTANLNLIPTDSFATCPPLDIILMGAAMMNYKANEAEISFLRKCEPTASALLFICGGFEPAMAAGLLHGKTATAPRPLLPMLRQAASGTDWVEKRWARDGKIWTSGALLNGLDMVKTFLGETWGGEGTLVDLLLKFGGWPIRDVDYKDVPWAI